MPRRRFFISPDRIQNGTALLSADQAHHLRNVLRLRDGDSIELFDGTGIRYCGLVEFRNTEVRVRAIEQVEAADQSSVALALAAALIRPDRFEWILQKGTELGVTRFIPLETHFTNVRIQPGKLAARMERWHRIVREAAKQCRRLTLPDVDPPISMHALAASAEFAGSSRFMLHEKFGRRLASIPEAGHSVLLCIGPEGGWHDSETSAARDAGFRLVNMGPRILRAETAAIAATAIFQFLLEPQER